MVYYTLMKNHRINKSPETITKHSVKTRMREGSTWALSLYFNPNGT
jgi:hypothetical protein